MNIEGHIDFGFEPLAECFADILRDAEQRGAALCVQVGGETVIDIWAGVQDRRGGIAWQENTLVNVFSCGKPLLAVVVLQLVAEGKLQLDTPVAEYWPAFAAHGKQDITVRYLLNHRAGLPAIDKLLPPEALYDWNRMVNALLEQQPWWTPDTAHGYAPMTYGWLLGELVRQVESGDIGEIIARRICEPLGLDFFFGVPESEISRISDTSRIKCAVGDEDAQRLLQTIMQQPDSMVSRAFANPPSMLSSNNKAEWRRLAQPAATGHANARSLASFYAGLLQGKLLPESLVQQMREEQALGEDKTLLTRTRLGLGCMLEQVGTTASFGLTEHAFGHPGAGGSLGCADPQLDVSMGFVTNSLDVCVLTDPRAQRLNQALMACL